MKQLPYILSMLIFGFGGLAGESDHAGHSVTIVVRHFDKFNIQSKKLNRDKPFLIASVKKSEIKESSAIQWSSTQRGKKITVKAELSPGFTQDMVRIVKCDGGIVAGRWIPVNKDRDFIVNLCRSGECILDIESQKHGSHTEKEIIIYTIVDTY